MGKMQEALRKAEEARSRGADAAVAPGAATSAGTGTATSFAISGAMRGGEVDPHLVTMTEPHSGAADQYRALAAELLALSPAQPFKVFMVTSSVPNEGRSVTALNLACAIAEKSGKRVIAVDADLSNPGLHRLLGIDNQRGLADYLSGGTMIEMVIQRSRVSNLWALPAGRTPPNPGELLGGKRMDDLLARLRRDYDFVVIDTAAVVSTSDASVLAPRADATLLVVRMERTPREVARHAVGLLKTAKANLVGTVLTGAGAAASR